MVALVEYCDKKKSAADVAKVTEKEYAHQEMQTDYFEADVPEA